MPRGIVAGIAVLALGLALGLTSAESAWAACPPTPEERRDGVGDCKVNASNSGTTTTIGGTQSGATGSGNTSGSGNSGSGRSESAPRAPEGYREPDVRFVTIRPSLSDIAHFRPTPGVDHMEPDGWFIAGLDANFYATGGSSVVNGTLLGYEAQVRFTPIRWTWAYGDGTSSTKSTKGNTWAALGLREFDPTPTSHIYAAPGTYYIDLTIGYRAEYNFAGTGWQTIAGTLWLPANRLVATVGSATTVLVDRDCNRNPNGPGCS